MTEEIKKDIPDLVSHLEGKIKSYEAELNTLYKKIEHLELQAASHLEYYREMIKMRSMEIESFKMRDCSTDKLFALCVELREEIKELKKAAIMKDIKL